MTTEEALGALVAGRLTRGAPADLIALSRNPLEELAALGDVRLVARAGSLVAPAQPDLATNAHPEQLGLLPGPG